MMMNKQVRLNLEDEVREFVGDFNKFFEDLEAWTNNNAHIKTWKDHFLKKYPKIFSGSSENEVEMDTDVDTTMRTKPPIDRKEKLRKVDEKLLGKRTNKRFTDCDGVMRDPNLTSTQKIIHLQKGIEDSTSRKIYYASLEGELFENCCLRSKKVCKETLKETKFTRQWVLLLRKLYKRALEYNQIMYCTVSLSYICSNFKISEEICKLNKTDGNNLVQDRVSRLRPINFLDFGDFNCCPSNIFFINILD